MENVEESTSKPRRRRRRRRKGPRSNGAANANQGNMRKDLSGPPVNLPPTGQAPNRRMAVRMQR